MKSNLNEVEKEKLEQKQRGERIKYIRKVELKMNKTQLGEAIGISGQFLGLVEDGRGNLVYKSIKKLRDLSGHSADYILFGIDDKSFESTKNYLEKYSEKELMHALNIVRELTQMIKKN